MRTIGKMEARELILPRHHLMLLEVVNRLPPSERLQGLQVLTLEGDKDNEMWEERFGLLFSFAQKGSSEDLTNLKNLASALLQLPKLRSLGGTSPAVQAIVNRHPSRWRAISQKDDSGSVQFELLSKGASYDVEQGRV